jgi:hypothetical protein
MPKPTTAQQALIHMLTSIVVSALLTIAGLVYQFVLGHGLDVPSLLKFIGPVFLGQLSLIWMRLGSNPNLQQAETDTIHEALQGLHDKLDNLLPFLHSHPVVPPTSAPAPVAAPQLVQMPFNPASSATATVPQLSFPTGAGMVIPQAINTTLGSMPAAPKS